MTEWQKVKLGDVADVIGGGTPSTKNYDFWNGDISWLTPKDLSGYKERYISKGERNITASGLQNSSARILPKGDCFINKPSSNRLFSHSETRSLYQSRLQKYCFKKRIFT